MRSALACFLLLAILGCIQASVIIESGPLNGTIYRSAEIYRRGDDYNTNFEPITGLLVYDTVEDIAGKIVYIEDLPKRDLWYRVIDLKDRGAIAVIHGTNSKVPGREYCSYTGQDASQIQIHVAGVKIQEFSPVLLQMTEGYEVVITLTSEGNTWSKAFISISTAVFMRGICGAASIGLIAFGLWKLIMFVKRQGSHFNVPQVCLALEIIANIWRILSTIVDPLGCHQVLPTVFSNYANAAALPFGTATFVLVTFYWHEIISDSSIKIHTFLNRLKIPFFVIMLCMIALDITLTISSYYLDFGPTLPVTIVYLVISSAFLIFYIVTAVEISKRMREAQKIRKVTRLNRVNTKMIMNAASRFAAIIAAIAFALLSSDPESQIITVYFLVALLLFDSFCRIFLFDIPPKGGSSASNTSNKTAVTAVGGDTTSSNTGFEM
eukprot:TRINITY_DN344_c0_g1_i2.p1 TRINITY_DN344_c0_g1~~TRINITY_DN344_c0_g1_i2.p1  ORF type:complete len:437 (-),score=40.10 TRINITY_DN344_c0_g1_i2:28-1338(-)